MLNLKLIGKFLGGLRALQKKFIFQNIDFSKFNLKSLKTALKYIQIAWNFIYR